MALSEDEVTTLAEERYSGDDEGYDDLNQKLFGLLVDVADAYVKSLEREASDDPAPFFAGTTPMQCAMLGLRENLDMRRGDA